MSHMVLCLGFPHSGKSAWAEDLAAKLGGGVCYVATLPDRAFHARLIADHRRRRPPDWQTLELSGELHRDRRALQAVKAGVVLVDGLSAYLHRQLAPWSAYADRANYAASVVIDGMQELLGVTQHLIVVSNVASACPGESRGLVEYTVGALRRMATRTVFFPLSADEAAYG